MIRVITMVVLTTFIPMQLYAVDFGGFGTDTQIEYFVPRSPDKPQEQRDQQITEKILENPPKAAADEKSGTNWWLWGGLAAVGVGVIALAAGGGKSSGNSGNNSGGGATTTTVTGSW